jgi:hypothetical protein
MPQQVSLADTRGRSINEGNPLAVAVAGGISFEGDISASTEYDEGAAVATAKGSVLLWKDTGNALRAVTASKPLPVNFTNASLAIAGSVGVVSQLDLSNSNPITVAIVDGSGDQISSFGGGTQYTEGDTDVTITGTAFLWEGDSNTLATVSAANPLPVSPNLSKGTGDVDSSTTRVTVANNGVLATILGAAADAASATGSFAAKLRAIATDTAAILTRLNSPIPVSGSLIEVAASFTRPANTTAYTTRKAVSNSTTSPTVLTFANAARANGGSGYISAAFVQTSQTTMTGQLRLHLFKVAPTAINDGSAYTLLNTNNANRIGYIDFTSFVSGDTGSDTAQSAGAMPAGGGLPYICDAAGTSIFGLFETTNGFTPANAQTFRVQLLFDRY